jgi:hypothetical protein
MRYVFLFLVWVTPAQAGFYNYSEWEQLSVDERGGYIAGAIDLITSYATGDDASAPLRYRECIAKSKMRLSQLDKNVRAYVQTQPDLQAGDMTTAPIKYLVALCGAPPKQ